MKDVVVLTGAGSGIGLAMARVFKNEAVLICGRTQSKIDAAVESLKADGIDAYGMSCDVASISDVEALARKAQELGNIRYLVNNAAVGPGKAESIYRINMLGTIIPSDIFYPLMAENGVVINVASIAGHMYPTNEGTMELVKNTNTDDFVDRVMELSSDDAVAYSLSKRFVIDYSKYCCVKYAEKGIRVLCISPGTFQTDMLEAAEEENPILEGMLKATPSGRVGDPMEIARLVEFLVSDKATYLNGADIVIDGGFLCSGAQIWE